MVRYCLKFAGRLYKHLRKENNKYTLQFIKEIIKNEFVVSARKLASLTGKIISTNAVLGNISRLMTRHCSMSVSSATHWDLDFQLDQYCIKEI